MNFLIFKGISVTGKVFEVAQGVTYFSDINIRNEDAHITLDKHGDDL